MNEKNVNECLYCGCYDEDFGCTMPSIDKWYACPLERNEEELREMFNMSNELIRKSELLEKLNDLYEPNWTNDDYDDYVTGFNLGLGVAIGAIEELQPVNAVELPCKVGDTIFTTNGGVISESIVKRITIFKDGCLLTIKDLRLGEDFMIEEWDIDPNNEDDSKYTFFTREEAEKALEDLKNDK